MTVSRRKFVKAGAMMGLSVVALRSGGSVFGQQSTVEQGGLFQIPAETQAEIQRFSEVVFSQYISTKFRIYTSPLTAVDLELIKVSRRESPSSDQPAKSAKTPKLDCFSVVFRGPRNRPLESSTYRVVHDQMGTFYLFITPVDDHKKQRRYQAVFNRVEQ